MSERLKLILVGVFLGVAWGLYWSWPVMTRPYAATAAPKLAVSEHGASEAVVATLWTGSSRVGEECPGAGCMRVDVLLENRSAEPVGNLHLVDFKAPGFDEEGPCWLRDAHYPACPAGATQARAMASTLGPGASVHVWARLRPAVAAGRFGLMAVFAWSQAAAKPAGVSQGRGTVAAASHSGSVTLQPIEITSPAREVVGTTGRWLQGLALPILLAWLAWRLQRADKDREIQRSDLETERSRKHEVWKEQLGRIFKDTQEHYSHVARKIGTLKKGRASAGFRDQVFYDFVMLMLYVRQLRDARGGWFFSTKSGEEALFSGWSLLVSLLRSGGVYEKLDAAASVLKTPLNWSAFQDEVAKVDANGNKAAGAVTLEESSTVFLAWFDRTDQSFEKVVAVLTLLRIIIRFEWDRPFYLYWYEEQPKFPVTEWEAARTGLPADPADLVKAFGSDLEVYRKGVDGFLQERRKV